MEKENISNIKDRSIERIYMNMDIDAINDYDKTDSGEWHLVADEIFKEWVLERIPTLTPVALTGVGEKITTLQEGWQRAGSSGENQVLE